MNSEDRRKGRYERRKAKREAAKVNRNKGHDFNRVSSFGALLRSYYVARKGVRWKASVQRYGRNVLRNSLNYSRMVRNGKDITKGFIEFEINERGKKRQIKSVHISERVVQKSVCDYGIVPVMEKSLIYDNGASQKGKGTEHSAQGLIKDLKEFYRSNGFSNDGYILLGDLHNFFGSIRHDVVEKNTRKAIMDSRLADLTMSFVYPFGHGLGLGSQVDQIEAVGYANHIDHYIKEVLRCKWYGKYMDDWYIIAKDKEELKHILSILRKMYADIGIELNDKKTHITKISHTFVWLQDRYFIDAKGKVVRRPSRKSITRNRVKLKKMARLLDEGKIKYADVRSFYESYKGYMKHRKGYKAKRNMDKLHNALFIKNWRWQDDQMDVSYGERCDSGHSGYRKAG